MHLVTAKSLSVGQCAWTTSINRCTLIFAVVRAIVYAIGVFRATALFLFGVGNASHCMRHGICSYPRSEYQWSDRLRSTFFMPVSHFRFLYLIFLPLIYCFFPFNVRKATEPEFDSEYQDALHLSNPVIRPQQ